MWADSYRHGTVKYSNKNYHSASHYNHFIVIVQSILYTKRTVPEKRFFAAPPVACLIYGFSDGDRFIETSRTRVTDGNLSATTVSRRFYFTGKLFLEEKKKEKKTKIIIFARIKVSVITMNSCVSAAASARLARERYIYSMTNDGRTGASYGFIFLLSFFRGKAHPRTEAECLSMFFTARPALSTREKRPPLIFLLYRFSL